jgi:hypothetical protein
MRKEEGMRREEGVGRREDGGRGGKEEEGEEKANQSGQLSIYSATSTKLSEVEFPCSLQRKERKRE